MELGVSKQQKLFLVTVFPWTSRRPRHRVSFLVVVLAWSSLFCCSFLTDLRMPSVLEDLLENPSYKHQERSRDHGGVVATNMLVEDISNSQGLHEKSQQVAQPELVVRECVGSDGVLATKVQQEEGRPERDQLVLARPAADGEVAQSVYRRGVRHEVRQP
ncbi:unnamed protein product [Miscanthus lutarioriparius]|uniref:Uncharacterized protein n=1 Tax=Miscanthus lutarioriparius TaxID=422564 RepID=A0A811RDI2_9POAL|nr:unnamed protein product [Miscanthus lutarioriparius]